MATSPSKVVHRIHAFISTGWDSGEGGFSPVEDSLSEIINLYYKILYTSVLDEFIDKEKAGEQIYCSPAFIIHPHIQMT